MRNIRVDAAVYIWLALGILILPVFWLIGAILAAIFHELFHFMMVKILNVHICKVTIDIGGMEMELEPLSPGKEFLIALAGPMGSFLLCSTLRVFPELAICGLVQGAFNLLPIFPLDGGRLLYCLLGKWGSCVEMTFILAILATAAVFGIRYGIYPILFAVLVTAKAIQRKFPCKESNLAVQ